MTNLINGGSANLASQHEGHPFTWIAVLSLVAVILHYAYGILKEGNEANRNARGYLEKLLNWKRKREHKKSAEKEEEITDADPEARHFCKTQNKNPAIVGGVIEVSRHSSIKCKMDVTKMGVKPNEVEFLEPIILNYDETLKKCSASKGNDPENRLKYGFIQLPNFAADNTVYITKLSKSDYNTWKPVNEVVRANRTLRDELASLEPGSNKIPQAIGLQYILRFRDNSILVMLNGSLKDSERLTWSFSGEEQLEEWDVHNQSSIPPLEHLFRRAIVEEVFGDSGNLSVNWENCRKFVDQHRLWAFFLEYKVGLFQMLGFIQLNITPTELAEHHKEKFNKSGETPDGVEEGEYYYIQEGELEKLLHGNKCDAIGLYSGAIQSIEKRKLHRTSLYRIWRLQKALTRK